MNFNDLSKWLKEHFLYNGNYFYKNALTDGIGCLKLMISESDQFKGGVLVSLWDGTDCVHVLDGKKCTKEKIEGIYKAITSKSINKVKNEESIIS